MSTQIRIVNNLTATVALMVLLIGVGAFILSYDALYATGAAHGLPLSKVWIWPLLIDAPLIVFTLALLISQLMRSSAKLWAVLVILYTLATIGFNLSHAQPTPLGWAVAIVAPMGLLLTTEALRHLAKTIVERAATVQSLAELCLQLETRRADLDKLNGQIEQATAKLNTLKVNILREKSANIQDLNAARFAKIEQRRAAVLSLLQEGLTPADISSRLDVTVRTIKKDIAALNGKEKVTS
jgi:hypothetical protein